MRDSHRSFPLIYGEFDPLADTRPIRVSRPPRSKRSSALALGLFFGIIIALYLFLPLRTNILMLGIDRAPEETDLARTDTMILTTIIPLEPYIGMLSIPRDLWVRLPNGENNRINTAHFFAESLEPGTGPEAAKQVVMQNFGVDVHYYIRFQFDGFENFVDALGGIPIRLEEAAAGYAPGEYVLNGVQALAFVRDRLGTDDFFRMSHGQLFLKAMVSHLIKPVNWIDLLKAIPTLITSVDTDVPLWLWLRMGMALLRAGPDGMDVRSISREMVQGFTTDQGAQVLAPNWAMINPQLMQMFGQ
jgi:LCP family protein required for cell wall assembly